MSVLFIIVIIGIMAIILTNQIKSKRKRLEKNYSPKPQNTVVLNEQSTVSTNKEEISTYRSRMDLLRKRDDNRTRKRHAWAILRFMKSIESIESSKNFYDLDMAICDFQEAKTRLREEHYHPTNKEIDLAIRFCSIQHVQGVCLHQLTTDETYNIHNWDTLTINESFIPDVATSFKTYWDDVLGNYQKPSARKNRICYLIKHLNEMKEKDSLQQVSKINEQISKLISYYESLQ